ncbi:MAG TPA: HD domain-containing protein [Patescibacteria group bacterium]|jgi:poly(A) polymerase/tRNA nucleotidyltransferase (CCA-adding enzyme)
MAKEPAINLPPAVRRIAADLAQAGFEAYAVGGGVRDRLLGREPKDWDVATPAKPEDIQKAFPRAVYANRFGTVGVKSGQELIEVTTYRAETEYRDARHPEKVVFVKRLEDDLARRDFTVNAMATDGERFEDPFGGRADLKAKRIRAVGDPDERFQEDALRLIRAVRFAVELDFVIEADTLAAVAKHADRLNLISAERVRDEFMRIIASDRPGEGIRLLIQTGLLEQFLPELLEGKDFAQAKHHTHSVLEHNVRSLDHVPSRDPLVRLAALLHDVGKPRSARGEGEQRTFHGHEVIGAKMTKEIMRRFRFSNDDTKRVVNLVRQHMFLFQFESTDKAIRRIVKRVGPENVDDLIALRVGDRLGSGTKVGLTGKLKKFKERSLEVQKEPISTRMLAVDGNDLMRELDLKPGPEVGRVQDALLEEVLDDPKRNTKEHLLERAKALHRG